MTGGIWAERRAVWAAEIACAKALWQGISGGNITPIMAWRRLVWPGQRERGEGSLESDGSQAIQGLQDLLREMVFTCRTAGSDRLRRSQQEEDWLASDRRQVPSVEAEVTECGVYRSGELVERTLGILSGCLLVTL